MKRKRERLQTWHKPEVRYRLQKSNARRRGIVFKLTFEEWWGLWEASGHYEDYGRDRNKPGGGYCMCRTRDRGGYELGNVRIATYQSNNAESGALRGV
jgi:hypothetical protein